MTSINIKRPVGVALVLVGLVVGATSSALTATPASANSSGDTISPVTSLRKGLTDRTVARISSPTDIAFTPDGRALITSDPGRLRVLSPSGLVRRPAVSVAKRICDGGERGLLGVTVDPDFANNRRIYIFWTFDKFSFCGVGTDQTPVNRVTRYRLGADNRVVAGSARVVVDNIPSPATNHNAGDLAFGSDGLLYVSTGDGGCQIGVPDACGAANDNSRRLDLPLGKVLRVTPNGGVPDDNPFVGAPDARRCTGRKGPDPGIGPCLETFASGFRNPFRMDIKPGTSTPWVNDVGQDTWEEINRVSPGVDYGWNVREGFCLTGSTTDCSASAFTNPQYAYDHTTNCRSITGGTFVPKGTWKGRFAGDYLFADFVCGSLWRLHSGPDSSLTARPLAPASNPVALTFGPSDKGRALYYVEYVTGQIHRITTS